MAKMKKISVYTKRSLFNILKPIDLNSTKPVSCLPISVAQCCTFLPTLHALVTLTKMSVTATTYMSKVCRCHLAQALSKRPKTMYTYSKQRTELCKVTKTKMINNTECKTWTMGEDKIKKSKFASLPLNHIFIVQNTN